jgi:hypothetical protein
MKKWAFFSIVFVIMLSLDVLGSIPDVDLEILGPAVVTPQEPVVGDKVSIVLYIYNNGPDDISGLVKIDWRVNGKNIGQTMIVGILADEQKEIKNTFKVKDKINKIKVTIATKMVPYIDNNIDNNIYEEEVVFNNLTPENESQQGKQGNIVIGQVDDQGQTGEQGIRRPGSHSGKNPNQSGSAGNGNSSSTGNNSNKEQGNPPVTGNNSGNTSGSSSDSSNQNSSSRESHGNADTSVAPAYYDSELNQLFTNYIVSYLKFYAKLAETIAKESNSGRKTALAVLKQDVDTLHSNYIIINAFNVKGAQSSAAAPNISWDTLDALLVKIEAGLDAFDEFNPMKDEYIDNSEDYLSKAKDVLGG